MSCLTIWAGILLAAGPLSASPVLLNTWTEDSFGGILRVALTFEQGVNGVMVQYSNQAKPDQELNGGVLQISVNGGAPGDVGDRAFMMWNERTGTYEAWTGNPADYRREHGFGYANDPIVSFSILLSGFNEGDELLFSVLSANEAGAADGDSDDSDDPPPPPPPPPDPSVPESSTTLLIGLGMAMLSLWGRRRVKVEASGR